jgi:hypothetical protein
MDDQVIREFYEFDDDDLYANRMGQLTEKQVRVAQARVSLKSVGGLLSLIGIGKPKPPAQPHYVLKRVQGPVQVTEFQDRSSHGHYYTVYNMKIEGVEFVLDDELVGLINQDDNCIFYYLDFLDGSEGLILSMERIP